MTISNSQIAGLGFVLAIAVFGLLFLRYVIPKVDLVFRSPIKTAVLVGIVILVIQTVFILAGSATG